MAAVNFQSVGQEFKARQVNSCRAFLFKKCYNTFMRIFFVVLIFLFALPAAFAQEHQSTNELMSRMRTALNLSDDQVSNITQIVDRYVDASKELEKSIDDGTINPSAVDSQKELLKAAEGQGIAQYLRPDQLSQWNIIQKQMDDQKEGNVASSDESLYSNLPRDISSQN